MRRPCAKKGADNHTDVPPPWEGHPPPLGVGAMADAQIEKAMREGVLDNLPGKGKPMEKDPGVGACQILAYCYCPPRH